jgi:ribosomal protein RSM22 (predicted rRNA methylase)
MHTKLFDKYLLPEYRNDLGNRSDLWINSIQGQPYNLVRQYIQPEASTFDNKLNAMASEEQVLLYTCYNFQLHYHSFRTILEQCELISHELFRDIKPLTILDIGAGPGTASIALISHMAKTFSDREINVDVVMVEPSNQMRTMSDALFNIIKEGNTRLCLTVDHKDRLCLTVDHKDPDFDYTANSNMLYVTPKSNLVIIFSYLTASLTEEEINDLVPKVHELANNAINPVYVIMQDSAAKYQEKIAKQDKLINGLKGVGFKLANNAIKLSQVKSYQCIIDNVPKPNLSFRYSVLKYCR